ncbi:MAG: GntR family transcriptional regulator [Acidimicrobiia bacterium]|nr:GntR family transcriptional regulator [Acidimicrobiia bacterium]MDH3398836.1 GntR family transcriptional regulator [Acidimicrobiia bacterium]
MITRNPSLTEQVKAHLKERIVGGDFEAGRIPSETELATDLGVSRTTIRDALSRLEHEGSIYRKQGAGTFVNEPGLQIKSRLEEIWSYEEVLRDHGYTPSVRVGEIQTEPAGDQLAAELKLEPGEPLVVFEKLFLENDLPVVLTTNRIPKRLVSVHIKAADGKKPLYELLEDHCGRFLSYYLSDIVPVALGNHESGQLAVARRTPSISFEEVGFDQDNEPVVKATSLFRDDLLRFRLIRRKAGA